MAIVSEIRLRFTIPFSFALFPYRDGNALDVGPPLDDTLLPPPMDRDDRSNLEKVSGFNRTGAKSRPLTSRDAPGIPLRPPK